MVGPERGFGLRGLGQNLLLQAQQVTLTRGGCGGLKCVHLGGQRGGETGVVGCRLGLARPRVEFVEDGPRRGERGGIAVKALLQRCQRIGERLALV